MKPIITIILCLFLSQFSAAENLRDVKICISDVEPWGYRTPTGEIKGVLKEIYEDIRAVTGLSHQYTLQPHSRVLHNLKGGTCDFVILFKRDADTVSTAIEVGQAGAVKFLAYARNFLPKVSNISDLAGYKVAHVRGVKYGPEFDNDTTIEKVPVPNVTQGLKMLISNRVDVMVGSRSALKYNLDRLGFNPKGFHSLIQINSIPYNLYSSEKSEKKSLIPCHKEAIDIMNNENNFMSNSTAKTCE